METLPSPEELRAEAYGLVREAREMLGRPAVSKADVDKADELLNQADSLEDTADAKERIETRYREGPARTAEKNGLWLPSLRQYADIQTRALSVGTNSTGGFFVPPEFANIFFDRLRPASVFLGQEPRRLAMAGTTLNVPKIGASVSVAMTAENAQISPSDVTTEQVTLTARKLASLTYASRESLADSNPELRAVVAYDHERAIAAELDRQFLEGDGTGQNLTGIRRMSGVTNTELGSGNGGTIAMDDLMSAVERMQSANAGLNPDTTSWLMPPEVWWDIRRLKDTTNQYLVAPDPTEDAPRRLLGMRVAISSQIVTNEAVGSTSTCSWLALVDMLQVVVGQREDLEVRFDESFRFDFDQVAIRTTSRWSIAPINEEGVELITGINVA